MTPWARLRASLRVFAQDEAGNGTIEFVMIFPFFFVIFMSTFELGMAMTRQVMLDRGVDVAVRLVRLGLVVPLNHDTLKQEICDAALIIPNCIAELKLEMQPLNPRNWVNIPNAADCVDRADPALPPRGFAGGTMNQLMIIRACMLFDPFIPTTGLGGHNLGTAIASDNGGSYALVSMSSYVVEPN